MKKQLITCCLFLVLTSCTTRVSLDLAPLFFGKILDENSRAVDSAEVEVIDINAVGHDSIHSFIGRVYYSDKDGKYLLNLPGGVEWEENNISGKKEYTKYIESVTIKVSKIPFKDTVVTLYNPNYEESYVERDIFLKRSFCIVFNLM